MQAQPGITQKNRGKMYVDDDSPIPTTTQNLLPLPQPLQRRGHITLALLSVHVHMCRCTMQPVQAFNSGILNARIPTRPSRWSART